MIPVELSIAAANAIAAYFNYLCTPAGQAFAKDLNALILDPLVALLPKPSSAPIQAAIK